MCSQGREQHTFKEEIIMRINHNIAALNTHRQLNTATTNQSKSMEKLASGLRINKAGDDAAGLAISEKMRGQIRGLDMASKNAQDGISLISTAEGALNETHSILQRMRELTIQGANDTNVAVDRDAIKTELNQLSEEVDRIATTTQFNKQSLLDGTFGVKLGTSTLSVGANAVTSIDIAGMKADTTITLGVNGTEVTATDGDGNVQVIDTGAATGFDGTLNFDKLGLSVGAKNMTLDDIGGLDVVSTVQADTNLQIGANENQKLAIKFNDMQTDALNVEKTDLLVDTYANAQLTLTKIETAISTVSTERATMGAWQNRLDHTINNLNTSSENLTAAESRIRDVDYAIAA